ncbi:MAG TPA: hypothetical protein VIC29_09530 [Steroidobacteraceae bacterium]
MPAARAPPQAKTEAAAPDSQHRSAARLRRRSAWYQEHFRMAYTDGARLYTAAVTFTF